MPEREVEIIATPPPEALVVDADQPGADDSSSRAEPELLQPTPRMVPVLTPAIGETTAGTGLQASFQQDIEQEQPVPLGSSISLDGGVPLREVRVVSVLTQELSDGDHLVVGDPTGNEQFEQPAHHSPSAP